MIKVSNELMDNWNVILDEESIYNAYLSGDRHNSDCFLLSSTYFTDIQLNITNLQLINGVLYADINEVEGLPMNVERVNVEDGHLIAYYREGFGQMSRVDLGVVVGPKGDTGNTPNIRVGIVTTGNPGTNASVNITGTEEEPVLNFTIPRGNTGEVSEEELDTAVKSMANAVYDNANGDIVTFDDGAKDALIKSLLATIKPVQSGSGDPSPDNIRPISGRTGLTVTRAGKNLFNGVFSQHSPNQIQSAELTLPAGTYTYSQKYNGTPTWGVYVLRPDNTDIAKVYNANKVTFTLSQEESVVIRVYYGDGITPANITEAQIEAGSTATQYAPYVAPTTYPVTWETEAGTIYGGTLDVVSGVLTVDRVMETITKDEIWYGFATGSGNASAVIQLRDYQNVKYVDGSSSRNGAIASTGVEAQNYWVLSRQNEIPPDGDMCFAYSSTGQLRFHRSDVANITDLEAFKAAFPDTQIVYPLATPQTYQLTPVEVRTILGGNTIYTDAGSVSVDYVADTGIYIDNSINKVKRLIAGIETTYVASRNYNVGDFIVVNNDLLKVISAIASGETIVIGTNANITTVAEQLILLFNS